MTRPPSPQWCERENNNNKKKEHQSVTIVFETTTKHKKIGQKDAETHAPSLPEGAHQQEMHKPHPSPQSARREPHKGRLQGEYPCFLGPQPCAQEGHRQGWGGKERVGGCVRVARVSAYQLMRHRKKQEKDGEKKGVSKGVKQKAKKKNTTNTARKKTEVTIFFSFGCLLRDLLPALLGNWKEGKALHASRFLSAVLVSLSGKGKRGRPNTLERKSFH